MLRAKTFISKLFILAKSNSETLPNPNELYVWLNLLAKARCKQN